MSSFNDLWPELEVYASDGPLVEDSSPVSPSPVRFNKSKSVKLFPLLAYD